MSPWPCRPLISKNIQHIKKQRATSLALITKMSCANLYANRTKNGGRRFPNVKHECYGKLSVKSFLKSCQMLCENQEMYLKVLQEYPSNHLIWLLSDKVVINDKCDVRFANLKVLNGVMHAVNEVLMPPKYYNKFIKH